MTGMSSQAEDLDSLILKHYNSLNHKKDYLQFLCNKVFRVGKLFRVSTYGTRIEGC